jgi:hypothetical protein
MSPQGSPGGVVDGVKAPRPSDLRVAKGNNVRRALLVPNFPLEHDRPGLNRLGIPESAGF